MNKAIKEISAERLVYVLNNLDCQAREQMLGITKKHYCGKQAKVNSKQWYLVAAKKIHPDVCKLQGTERAFSKLNELYKGMQ